MDELHLLIISMDDELSGYRWREAIWLSILVHVVVFLAVGTAPYWLPKGVLVSAMPDVNHKNTTFLALPTDRMRATPPPKTDIISDKNRIAQSRAPLPNKEALRRLVNAQRPGAPAPAAPPPAAGQQQAQQQQPPGGGITEPPPPQPTPQVAQVQPPPKGQGPSPFKIGMSPIRQATQQTIAAAGHATSHAAFGGGDYGANRLDPRTDVRGDVDIISDTMGVDFGPYLQRVIYAVRMHWYNLIPESARPPIMKRGKLAIEFAILKDGRVAGLQLVAPSGDDALDRAARGGITDSNPFPPLPADFRGQYLQLRFKFYYNPSAGELE